MVHRKQTDKPKSPAEHKKIHGRLDGQDTRTRAGADLKKKLKKAKSIEVSDFVKFECKKTSSIPIRNYMKPTSSSDARKEGSQLTATSPVSNGKKRSPRSSKKSNSSSGGSASPGAVKVLSRQSSLKPVKSSMKKSLVVALCAKRNVNRATCSSTLKDSKFPSALELNHGATETDGASKIRVCPYTYCSLNGHMSEPLPPLKRFISARRKSLKAQRSLEVKVQLSAKASPLEKEEEMIDEEMEDENGMIPSDLSVEIYSMPQEKTVGENNCDEISILEENYYDQCVPDEVEYSVETKPQMNESSDIGFEYDDYDMDQDRKSEFSQDEMNDVRMNFLEYVEFDHERTATQKDCDEDGEIRKCTIKTADMNWEEEIFIFPDNTEISECPDEQFSVNTKNSYATSEETEDGFASEVESSLAIDKEDFNMCEFNSESTDDDVRKLSSEMMNCQSDESSLEDESTNTEKELQDSSNVTDRKILNVSTIDCKEIDGILTSRWHITTKRTADEFEQVKQFNPRPPNFLPIEPDLEAETVDLRHQIMDGRRNSEEWMIDHALQQAVTRLGPARKKKVALLVEAFETVIPLPMCEKPLSHATSTFNHLSFIQACN